MALLPFAWRQSQPERLSRLSTIRPYDVVAALLAAAFAFLIVYPTTRMFIRAFWKDGSLDLSAFDRMLSDPGLWPAVRNTVIILVVAGGLAMVIGSVFAWLNERTTAQLGWVGLILPLVPLLLPPVVLSIGWIFLANERAGFINEFTRRALGWVGLAPETGPFNIASWPGIIFIYTLYLVPYVFLLVSAALRNLDPALEEASRASGAGLIRTLFKVTLGSLRPALMASSLMIVVVGSAVFSIGRTIGTTARVPILSVHIVNSVQTFPSRLDEAVALGVCVVVVVGGLWWMQRRVVGTQNHASISPKSSRATLIDLGRWKWVARAAVIGYLALTSVLPILAIVVVSLQPFWTPNIEWGSLSLDNFRDLLGGTSTAKRSLQTSLVLGAVGATIGMIVAGMLMMYAKQRRTVSAAAIDGLTKSPGAVSNIVVGVAFIVAFAGAPFNLAGSRLILLLAYIVIYMPQASIAAGSATAQLPDSLLEASAVSGAGALRTHLRISLPLMLPALLVGWALLFVVMVGDLTASALLATTRTPVAGFVILNLWENGTFAQLAAMGAVISVVAGVVVVAVLVLGRPRSTRITAVAPAETVVAGGS